MKTLPKHNRLPESGTPKPPYGAPCNGCGICCLAEPCPIGMLRHFRVRGACPSVLWLERESRYVCGLVRRAGPVLRPLLSRWIAAGTGCDSGG